MTPDHEPQNEEKGPPPKPGGLETIIIFVFLLFVAWGTYEFGIWIIKDGGKPPQETERPF